MTPNRPHAWQRVGPILLGVALIPWSTSSVAGDPAKHSRAQLRRGEEVAQEQCSACHIVAEKQQYSRLLELPTPSFKSVANRADTTEKSLHRFVTTTHWDLKTIPMTMPNPGLSNADTVAVIRYILSLKGQ